MLLPMDLPHLGNRFVHQIFSSYVEWAGKVVDLLILLHTLVNYIFNWADKPNNGGLLFEQFLVHDSWSRPHNCTWFHRCPILIEILGAWKIPKPIVFKRISYQSNLAISHIKIVASIRRQIRSYLYRIFIHAKNQILFPHLGINFYNWLIFEQHRGKLFQLLFGFLFFRLLHLIFQIVRCLLKPLLLIGQLDIILWILRVVDFEWLLPFDLG